MAYRIWKPRLLVIPLITAFVLTSCQPSEPSEDPSPPATAETTQAVTPSPTVSATPTPKPATAEGPAENIPVPEMPTAAKNTSEEGSAAFLEHYFDLINYALHTYDTEPLEKLTSQSCVPCGEGLIDPIWYHADQGHWQVGGTNHLAVTGATLASENEGLVSFNLEVDAQTIYSAPNQIVEESPASNEVITGVAVLKLEGASSSWNVYDINMSIEEH